MNTTHKTDADIAKEFKGFRVTNITREGMGGYITIVFPAPGEHVAGGQEGDEVEVCDHFIDYNGDGKHIAFDNWYPESVYTSLCEAIRNV